MPKENTMTPKLALEALFKHACLSEKLRPMHYPELQHLAKIIESALPTQSPTPVAVEESKGET